MSVVHNRYERKHHKMIFEYVYYYYVIIPISIKPLIHSSIHISLILFLLFHLFSKQSGYCSSNSSIENCMCVLLHVKSSNGSNDRSKYKEGCMAGVRGRRQPPNKKSNIYLVLNKTNNKV